jgi:predicted dehydrogenase
MIAAVEGLELAAVVERSSRNAEAAYPGITTYSSLEAMLADASLELIVIGTPNTLHVPQAEAALRAGRHVVVDKPVAITSSELGGLIKLANAQGKLLIPFHNRRWDSDFQTLRKLLQEQRLGRIVALESTFDRWRQAPKLETWRDQGGPGTGILLDLGTHLADQALQLFGLPEAVGAEVLVERDTAVANDSFTIRLHYPRQVVTLAANCLSATSRPRYTVRGTKGGYVKCCLDPQEAKLKESNRITPVGWGAEPPERWGKLTVEVDASGNTETQTIEPIPGDYRLYYAGVRDAMLGKAAPPVLAMDAWHVARVLEWAEESSAEKRVIPCDGAKLPTSPISLAN